MLSRERRPSCVAYDLFSARSGRSGLAVIDLLERHPLQGCPLSKYCQVLAVAHLGILAQVFDICQIIRNHNSYIHEMAYDTMSEAVEHTKERK